MQRRLSKWRGRRWQTRASGQGRERRESQVQRRATEGGAPRRWIVLPGQRKTESPWPWLQQWHSGSPRPRFVRIPRGREKAGGLRPRRERLFWEIGDVLEAETNWNQTENHWMKMCS